MMRRKYLFLLAFLILAAFCMFQYRSFGSMQDSLVNEKFIDRKLDVDLMCDTIDRLVADRDDWLDYDYGGILQDIVGRLDAANKTCYELMDAKYTIIAERTPIFPDTPIIVTEYPLLIQVIQENERGEFTIQFDKPGIPLHDVRICFRWVPMDVKAEDRLLVMAGVSRFTVDNDAVRMIAYGEVGLITVAAVFVLSAVILLSRLGYIYNRRGGSDKWRPKLSS